MPGTVLTDETKKLPMGDQRARRRAFLDLVEKCRRSEPPITVISDDPTIGVRLAAHGVRTTSRPGTTASELRRRSAPVPPAQDGTRWVPITMGDPSRDTGGQGWWAITADGHRISVPADALDPLIRQPRNGQRLAATVAGGVALDVWLP